MQPRKVIIVIENIAGKGGTERVASGLANALARLPGYEVALFSLFGERSFFPLANDVRLRCGDGDSLFWPWRLAMALRRERADVIITVSMGKLSVVMTPFLRLFCARSRLLLSEHVSFHQYPRVFKWLKLLVYRLGDRVIFLTRQDSDAIARWVGAGKCRVIENVSPFGTQAPTPTLQKKVALAVGRLSNQKGFDRLIALWRGVAAQAPDWRLLIIGDGPERDALRRQIEDAGLERQVSLLPAAADVAAYYRQASLYLMTSRYEGLPMVLIEAMSFGLPLVAYDCKTGPAELIDDGVNGYLVPDDDAAAFSEGVIKLMLDPGLREHFSLAALEVPSFSPERIYPSGNSSPSEDRMEKISVIMPAYNAANSIKESILGVLNQRFTDYHLYVIDDASTDDTAEVVRPFIHDRLTYIRNEHNVAWRKRATSALRRRKATISPSATVMTYGSPTSCRAGEHFANPPLRRGVFPLLHLRRRPEVDQNTRGADELIGYQDMLKSNWIGNLTGIYNQKRIGKVYQQKVGHEDYLMWLAVLQKARNGLAYCIPEPLACYRLSTHSLSGNKIRAADWQWRIYRQHLGLSYQKSCYLFATYLFNAVVKRK